MNEKSEIPFPAVLDALFQDQELSIQLLFRLSDLSPEDMACFDNRWPDVSDERRRVIVRHLADISEDNFVVDFLPIFLRCFSDVSAPVRIAALDGVWDTENPSLIPPIIDLLQTDESVEVRIAAAAALAHFVLLAEWGQVSQAAAEPIVEALLAEYDRPDTAVLLRSAALEALSAAGHYRIAELIDEAYESEEPIMQLSAVFAMGGSADSRWLPILFEEVLSPLAEMRAEAARALGSIGDEAAVSELINLTIDEDLDVARAAVAALGALGGELASEALIRLADDPDFEDLYEAVVEALEEIEWLGGAFDLLSLADSGESDED
jgi:HEAT repeat protein